MFRVLRPGSLSLLAVMFCVANAAASGDVESPGRSSVVASPDSLTAETPLHGVPVGSSAAATNPAWWPLILLSVYCLLIVLSSLGGGWLPMLMSLTHTRMQLMLSLVGGLMLGIGLFHMLPHAYHELQSLDRVLWWVMVGLVTMFFLIRLFHFHQHEPVELSSRANADDGLPHQHGHDHAHDHHHSQPHRLGWTGIALGLSLHTLIDGIALGASVTAATRHAAEWQLLGLGTFLAVVLHKPLDAVSITSLMLSAGWTARWRHAVNAGFALMCPLGAILFLLGVERFSSSQAVIVGCALAFSSGVFLCISLGDLLPEMEFHSHNRLPLSIALITGIALAWGIRYLEPQHLHTTGGKSEIRSSKHETNSESESQMSETAENGDFQPRSQALLGNEVYEPLTGKTCSSPSAESQSPAPHARRGACWRC